MRRYILFFLSLSLNTRHASDETDEYGLGYGRYLWMFAVFFLGLTAVLWRGIPDAEAEYLLDVSELCTTSIGPDGLLHVSCQGSAETGHKTITTLHFTQVWQAIPDGKLRSYDEAVSYCADNEAGLSGSGWVLPNEDDFSDLGTALNPRKHQERIRQLLPKVAELGASERKSGLCYWAEFSETVRLQGLTYLIENDTIDHSRDDTVKLARSRRKAGHRDDADDQTQSVSDHDDDKFGFPNIGTRNDVHYSGAILPSVNLGFGGRINKFLGGSRRVCGIEQNPETRLPVLCIRGGTKDAGNLAFKLRFEKRNDGTVVDKAFGKVWMSGVSAESMKYDEAVDYCADKASKNHNWRLPTAKEASQTFVDDLFAGVDALRERGDITDEEWAAAHGSSRVLPASILLYRSTFSDGQRSEWLEGYGIYNPGYGWAEGAIVKDLRSAEPNNAKQPWIWEYRVRCIRDLN